MNSKKNNINLIILGCLDKNRQSQKLFFKQFFGLIKSICNRYANTEEQSEEMLNDSFYQIFISLGRYDSKRPIEPWISGITVNCCLMYQRKYFKILDRAVSNYEINEDIFDKIDFLDDRDFDYKNLLHKLSPAYRTIINLFIIEEYKHQEIADKLGISVGTSKSQLHRAKKQLYQMLEKDKNGKLKLKPKYDR